MSDNNINTPVLIVGGGPVGIGMSIELGYRGINSVLIEQGDGSIEHPRTGLVAVRTMEAFRRWGMVDDVRNCGFPETYNLSMVFCTSLKGLLLDREKYACMKDSPTPIETPEKKQRCPQMWLQPIMTKAALNNSHGQILFNHRFDNFVQSEHGVKASVTDLLTGNTKSIHSQYLLACDGASSVVRKSVGINMQGRLLSYSINILIRAKNLVNQHNMGEGERYMFVGPEGMWGNLTVVDGDEIWRLTVLGSEEKMNLETFDSHYWIERAFGTLDSTDKIPFEILSVTPWRRSEMLAEKYIAGRVFLVGDSAHTMSPTGGMGMNTGIQEVIDLGWKLEGALKGWAGPKLLESYDLERRPIAKRNISFSTQNFKAWQDTPNPQTVCDNSAEGKLTRAIIGKRLRDSTRVEWESMGLQIGHRYDNSPICIPDGSPATPDDFSVYIPTTRPGSRAPHAWLKDGKSTLDLFGKNFILLCFDSNLKKGITEMHEAFLEKNMPFEIIQLQEPEIAQLYEYPFVLVRPDGHVAWRGNVIKNAVNIVDTVRGAT